MKTNSELNDFISCITHLLGVLDSIFFPIAPDYCGRWARDPGFGHKLAAWLFGRFLVRRVPFTEAYFLEDALHVREVTRLPLVLVGGLRRLEQMENTVEQGFEFVAMARPFILESDLVRKLETGAAVEARCVPCNECLSSVASARSGVLCRAPRMLPALHRNQMRVRRNHVLPPWA